MKYPILIWTFELPEQSESACIAASVRPRDVLNALVDCPEWWDVLKGSRTHVDLSVGDKTIHLSVRPELSCFVVQLKFD